MTLPEWITPELINIVIQMVEAAVILVGLVLSAAWMIWLERRLLALWQDRYGPNRVGPFGLGIVIADMVKIFFKEDWTPPFVDKAMFWLAPMIAMSMMMLGFMLVPLTPNIGVADFNLAVLFFLAICGLGVYAVMLGGWASNSKFALIGGLRSSAQMITYEVFMGLSLMGVVMMANSFSLVDVVKAQQAQGVWNVIPQFLGFLTFSLAGVATTHRTPFDLPEAEQELAAGFHTEYSSMKFGMFFVGEYVGIVMISAITVVLFLGGWDVPFIDEGPVLAFFAFAAKTFILMSGFILLRAALPRPRYDHMMSAGWKVCLPMTLINVMATGAIIVATNHGGA
ncbi:MAG: NADH-quinone oxidoreductase subunit NuoH [Panacagrimonas sp.]